MVKCIVYIFILIATAGLQVASSQHHSDLEDILPPQQSGHFPFTNKIYLYQNYPNPFLSNQATVIRYEAVDAFSVAVYVYDSRGRLAVRYTGLLAGIHALTIEPGTLQSGVYKYRLFVNDRMVAHRKLTVTDADEGLALQTFYMTD